MRTAGVEPFPTIFVDSKEDGQVSLLDYGENDYLLIFRSLSLLPRVN